MGVVGVDVFGERGAINSPPTAPSTRRARSFSIASWCHASRTVNRDDGTRRKIAGVDAVHRIVGSAITAGAYVRKAPIPVTLDFSG
jgi:hypothetical protein